MPFCARLLVFTLGLMFAGVLQAQEVTNPGINSEPVTGHRQEESAATGDNDSGQQQPAATDPTLALKGIETAIRDLVANVDEIERQRQEEREDRDLHAQESMALWAKLMFWATAATVILTFVALYAIIRTLHHTRRAADYTEGMLSEAKLTTQQAIQAADAAEGQTFPILEIEKSYFQIKSQGPPAPSLIVKERLKNLSISV